MGVKKGIKNILGMYIGETKVVSGKYNNQTLFNYGDTPSMNFTIDTTKNGDNPTDKTFIIPFTAGDYSSYIPNVRINWGNGQSVVINDGIFNETNCTHTYDVEGVYTIRIYSLNSKIPSFNFYNNYFNINRNQYKIISMNDTILNCILVNGNNQTNFEICFGGCINMTTISKDLFKNNTSITSLYQSFGFNLSLLSIPTDLFRYNTLVSNFSDCFSNCNSLTTIPVDLFRYNTLVTNFYRVFFGCSSLTTIPNDLFKYNILVTNFDFCFGNTLITSIPVDLFRYNTLATNFSGSFAGCYALTTIPEYLFKYNTLSTNFSGCFYECRNLQLIPNIFCNELTEMTTRFNGKDINFEYCFSIDIGLEPDNTLSGIAPKLWKYTYNSVVSTDCFTNCTTLDNYDMIPINWGGVYDGFTFTIDTTKNVENPTDKTFIVPFTPANYGSYIPSLTINWGDSTETTITNGIFTQANCTHTYSAAGVYTIKIYSLNDKIPIFDFYHNYSGINNNSMKLISLDSFILTNLYNNGNLSSSFRFSFYNCYNLTTISNNLFKHNKSAIDFSGCFGHCQSLTSIPIDLFRYNTLVTYFSSCFFSCFGLTTIPIDLFRYNTLVDDFYDCFGECMNLTSIPNDLFKYNTLVTNFRFCFNKCQSLTSIPNDLFRYNTLVTDFSDCFYNCYSLMTIPEYLFRYNTLVTDFSDCFYNCNKLQLNPNIFCNEETEMTTRFSGKDIDFSLCFCYSSTSLPGNAPQLWNYTYGSVVSNYCFSNNSSLKNYDMIPKSWGGIYEGLKFIIDTRENEINPTDNTFIVPFTPGTYSTSTIGTIVINWGDSTSTTISDGVFNQTNCTHSYPTAGQYTIVITSTNKKMPEINFYNNYYNLDYNLNELKVLELKSPLYLMCDTNSNNLTSVSHIFHTCSNLTSVSENTFRLNNSIESFENCLSQTKITIIKEDLFRYNTSAKYFIASFNGVKMTTLPINLFKYNTNVLSFSGCFGACSSLTSVPGDLFKYNLIVTSFYECFKLCSNLQTVGEYLFRYNRYCNSFAYCFWACNKLQLNSNMFCDELTEKDTRFTISGLGMVSFYNCFARGSFSGTQGTTPTLWNYFGNLDGMECFYGAGNSLTSISNYNLIPLEWKS